MISPSALPEADICLILEGTYPYVRGGVSGWVHQMVEELKDFRFSIMYVGSEAATAEKLVYEMPKNIIGMEKMFLFDRIPDDELKPGRVPARAQKEFYAILSTFYLAKEPSARLQHFWRLIEMLQGELSGMTLGNLMHDFPAWEILIQSYEREASHMPFVDYFWTTRFLHLPIWQLIRHTSRVPRARLYHSITAGYAGVLASMTARLRQRRCLLTEHGIYSKERIAEISQADWLYEPELHYFDYQPGGRFFKDLWIESFLFFGYAAYSTMSKIITLYGGNQKLQIEFGAPPERTEIIPNGIDPFTFDEVRREREAALTRGELTYEVGYMGRIVSIKDVETLIRAAAEVVKEEPQAKFRLYGPYEEEPEYYTKCLQLVISLGLITHVDFPGNHPVKKILPKINLMVLTSISEGLPLVILEAYAAAVPVVATDVGSCRELLHGLHPEDKALGAAGILTPTGSPVETARAILRIIRDPDAAKKMGAAGRQRAEKFYRLDTVVGRYRDIYRENMSR